VSADQLLGYQGSEVLVGEHLDRVQLVRCPETVEEVHERDPGLEGGRVGNEGQVVGLLDRRRGK
jgi:hypothetical protein